MNYWDQILKYLQQRISQQSYDNWFTGTAFLAVDGDTLFVSTPDRETRTWLETEYSGLIRNGIKELGLPVRHVSFESQMPVGVTNQSLAAVDTLGEAENRLASLNPKFTFGNFVVV